MCAGVKVNIDRLAMVAGLIAALEDNPACQCLHLEKDFGETQIAGLHELEKPAWQWPAR